MSIVMPFKRLRDRRHQLGMRGEKLARRLLRSKNYLLLERNWRHASGEVDILALDGGIVVGVEVKTRVWSKAINSLPRRNWSVAQRRRLRTGIKKFLKDRQTESRIWRCDLIEVIYTSNRVSAIYHHVGINTTNELADY